MSDTQDQLDLRPRTLTCILPPNTNTQVTIYETSSVLPLKTIVSVLPVLFTVFRFESCSIPTLLPSNPVAISPTQVTALIHRPTPPEKQKADNRNAYRKPTYPARVG